MERDFFRKGLHFTCKRCSACCRHDPGFVNISEQDLTKLLLWSGLSRNDFIETYCRWIEKPDGYDYLCLKEKKNFDCILWDNGCTAYNNRPFQCSSYPFWPSLLSDKDWWDANAQDCPGVNTGEIHGYDEINAFLEKRKAEPYIKKKRGR